MTGDPVGCWSDFKTVILPPVNQRSASEQGDSRSSVQGSVDRKCYDPKLMRKVNLIARLWVRGGRLCVSLEIKSSRDELCVKLTFSIFTFIIFRFIWLLLYVGREVGEFSRGLS